MQGANGTMNGNGGPKRILLLGSHAGSLLNFRAALIRDLIGAGHDVIAAAPDITPDIEAKIRSFGASLVKTPMSRTGINPLADYRYLQTLRQVMRERRPDFVLTYTIKPNIWGAMAAHSEGIPSAAMVTGLGYAFTDSTDLRQRAIGRLVSALYRRATDRNSFVVFQNPDDRDDFAEAGCLAGDDKIVMTNGSGVDVDHYSIVPLPGAPVFLMIARLLGNKGAREFARAAIKVKAVRPQCRFLLAGYLDEGPDAIAQSELDKWIESGIEYLGPLEDVRPAITEASCYVLPSYREGTPRSVLEAMAMGRPIITSDAPGCRETVQHGVNGFLVPIRDDEELARRMIVMASDAELRENMGAQSRRIAVEKYRVETVNRHLMRDLELTG